MVHPDVLGEYFNRKGRREKPGSVQKVTPEEMRKLFESSGRSRTDAELQVKLMEVMGSRVILDNQTYELSVQDRE